MIGIVKRVEKIFVEGMYVLEAGETVENRLEFVTKSFGCKLDLSSVEAYSTSCQHVLPPQL